ncbi:hypothetical protein PSTG_12314 [Puccinia striiformis f. sp. tritici PST-78]|uniref:Uncharacterized protein n=1 Tax=Puccinia striiformis f. sp. tritici PST-78 TaxID=1165861 RepID=A0A0L0V5J5_9BASI|nr:hypothetical protein PSTG_12314 [Puccinia striiformis f. sp. tritici PST-78]
MAQLQHKYPAMLVYPAWHNPSPTPSYLTEPAAFCLFIHPTSYAANSKMFSITRSFVALVLICSTLNILVHAVPNSLVSITGGVGPIGGTVEPLVKLPGSIRKRAPATVIAGGVGTLGLSTEPLIKLPGTIRKRASGTEPFIVNWDPKHTGDKGKRASATEPIHNLPISKDSKKGKRAAATEPIDDFPITKDSKKGKRASAHDPIVSLPSLAGTSYLPTSCQSIISEANELLFEGMSTLPQDMTTTTATAHAMARTLFSCIELLLVPIASISF